jgi:acyl carrier protein
LSGRSNAIRADKTGRNTVINIVEGVRNVIALHLGAVDATMTEDAKLAELGADSLDIYEIAMSLEETFNIPISDDEADNFVTVGDAIAFVKGKVS